jgi:hypothetical protein
MDEMADQKLTNVLDKLKSANLRLRVAMDGTVQNWPNTVKCWIDQISEPTTLLAKHRLLPEPKKGE